MNIWVDDLRPAPEGYHHVYSSDSAIYWLRYIKQTGGTIGVLSLDHDLGGDDTSRKIVIWMCENDWWPKEVRCHSANPVGRDWIEGMIERYKS